MRRDGKPNGAVNRRLTAPNPRTLYARQPGTAYDNKKDEKDENGTQRGKSSVTAASICAHAFNLLFPFYRLPYVPAPRLVWTDAAV